MATRKNGDGAGAIKRSVEVVSKDLLAQHEYSDRLKNSSFDFSLVVADAFVRGMRDIGYKSTGTALDELIDNAMQAEAENIHVIFGFNDENRSEKKVDKIAVVDDGHGMPELMVRASVLWGGTHREGDRKGFGRYGYGLPSASLSQGERFSVYSLEEGSDWYKVHIDVQEITEGKYTNAQGRVIAPEPVQEQPPSWVRKHLKAKWPDGFTHGSIVVLEHLDRTSFKTTESLKDFLLSHFGVVYRNFLREVNLEVHGTVVDPVDPLFTTPGYRFYDLDEDRAEALDPLSINVKDKETKKVQGTIRVRFSYMPPTFARFPEDKFKERGKNNARFKIMNDHNGIIILRNGRQIDVVTRSPWGVFVNYDRYWGCEVDFDPTLDEEFSITTSKQQVGVSERIWEILRESGVQRAIEQMRSRFKKENAKLQKAREEDEERKRASEAAMEESKKFGRKKAADKSADRKKRARKKLEEEARKRARQTGKPYEQTEHELEQETEGQPYKVKEEDLPGSPFYRAAQVGGQLVLYINTAHRFYTDLYVGPGSTPRLRAALELLLFIMGEAEEDSTDARRLFYETERDQWSKMLSIALDRLNQISNIEDHVSATMNEGDQSDAAAASVAGSVKE